MYAGYIVETGTVDEIFHNPRHPYRLGLLKSIPRLHEACKEKLVPIEGLPPDLIDPPQGCLFQPRCVYAVQRCIPENPSLEPVVPGHRIACWVDVALASRRRSNSPKPFRGDNMPTATTTLANACAHTIQP